MRDALIILGTSSAVFVVLMLLPPLRIKWAEGWLIPHWERQEQCRFECGTCKRRANKTWHCFEPGPPCTPDDECSDMCGWV